MEERRKVYVGQLCTQVGWEAAMFGLEESSDGDTWVDEATPQLRGVYVSYEKALVGMKQEVLGQLRQEFDSVWGEEGCPLDSDGNLRVEFKWVDEPMQRVGDWSISRHRLMGQRDCELALVSIREVEVQGE